MQEGVLYWCGNQARQDCYKLQFVVPQEYRLEAMYEAHNDVGHLVLEQMLDILWDKFYWQTWRMISIIIYEPVSAA